MQGYTDRRELVLECHTEGLLGSSNAQDDCSADEFWDEAWYHHDYGACNTVPSCPSLVCRIVAPPKRSGCDGLSVNLHKIVVVIVGRCDAAESHESIVV